MNPRGAALLALILLASAFLLLVAHTSSDPLAQFRAPDGSLHIPGGALTPELQRVLFGGDRPQPYYNLTYYALAGSAYPTAPLRPAGYLAPNPNVFTHPTRYREDLAGGIGRLASRWFPPIDWGAAARATADWFFGLFLGNARAAVTVDSTTTAIAAAVTCTTTQTATAGDNAILVILSEGGTTAYASVTYGTANLSLITGASQNGGTSVRIEIWGYVGSVPAGSQTMTATLSGGTSHRQACATILLAGVSATGSFINGTGANGTTANASITFTPAVSLGNVGFAGLALAGNTNPSGVSGTGASATSLYGTSTALCAGGNSVCGAGASIPYPGSAITWTSPAARWATAAVEVVEAACGSGGADCYRIGAGGAWSSSTNWSNFSGYVACNCTPAATDRVFFDANASGTVNLSAATTVASLDMTGFAGTLDTTTANSWSLTVNGDFTIQGTLLARGSTIAVTGNVTVASASSAVNLAASSWTVNGTWTNNSTSASWSGGTSTVLIEDAAGGALAFANLPAGANEFNNLTLDASVATGLTYTMATNGLRAGGTLLLQNSTAGATGPTVLDSSAGSLAITSGALTVATWGALNSESSTVTINGAVNISAASGYVTNIGGTWTVTGSWRDTSASGSWSFGAALTFRSGSSQTMTFGAQPGNEFSGAVTFDSSSTGGVAYTLSTNSLDIGGLLTIQNSMGGATGPVVVDTSAGNLAVTAAALSESTFGALNTRSSTIAINGDVTVGATSAYVTNTGGSWTVTGAWTDRTTSASWSFAAAMMFRAAASKTMIFTGSNIPGNEFGGAVTFDTTAAAGITYSMGAGVTGDSALRVGGSLTIRNGAGGASAATILDTSLGNYGLIAGSLTLGTPRGALRSEGSNITINGAVNVSDANSYLVLGSAAWTVTGSWTNSSTDSVDWSAGTGTVTFRATANATMTFGNLGANEANNVVFDTTVVAGIAYTMATNGLRIAGTLTVQNTAGGASGNTVLTTSASNLPITSGSIVLGSRGTLTANGSTLTVNGSWTSTAANHVWNKGTSTVVFGASGTLTMSSGESFNLLTQSAGTTTLGSSVMVSGAVAVNGTLDTSSSSFSLTLQAALSIGPAGVLNLEASTASTSGNVTIAAGGAVRFTGAGTWTINGSWTNSNATIPASWAVSTATVRIVASGAATLTFWTATGSEFNNLTLDASAAAGLTYSQINTLRAAGALTLQNAAGGATGAVILDASASNYGSVLGGLVLGALGGYASRSATVTVSGSVSIAGSGYVSSAAGGTWTVTGSWSNASNSGSWSFVAPITFQSATSQSMTFKATGTEFGGAVTFDTTWAGGVTYTLATNGLTTAGLLTVRNSTASPTGNTVLDTSNSGLPITAGSVTLGTNGTLQANGSTIGVGGAWAATAANALFLAGTGTVVFTAAATIAMTQAFNNLTVATGTTSLASNLTATGAVTVSGGILAKGAFTFSAASLVLSGGALTSTSGAGTITGSVNVSSSASYIAFGSEIWTVGGTWTNASTSGSWSPGTGSVVFNASSPVTMVFAGTNLTSSEFNNLTFDTAATAGVTYSMASQGLRVGGVLLIRNSTASPTGNTVLDTSGSNLPITTGSVILGPNGTLAARGSLVSVAGNWTSTASGAMFNPGTSTVTFTASATLTPGGSQAFYNLTIASGTATLGSSLVVTRLLTVTGTLDTSASSYSLAASGGLTVSGPAGVLRTNASALAVTGDVSISGTAAFIVSLAAGSWTVTNGGWANVSNSGSWSFAASILFLSGAAETVAFGNLPQEFGGNVTFDSTSVAGATFTMAPNGLGVTGTLTIQNTTPGATGDTILDTSGSSVSVSATTLRVAAGGSLKANGSTITVTSIDTHMGAFAADTSTVVVAASGGSVNISQTAHDLTVTAGVSTAFAGSLVWSGTLTLTSANVAFGASGLASSGAATITFASATISMDTGDWDTSSATSFVATGSSVTFTGTGTLNPGSSAWFSAITITGGTRTLLGSLGANGPLTLSGGVLGVGSSALTANGALVLSGGALTSGSGPVSVGGNVDISAAASYIVFGTGTWTVGGSWTNASTSSSWSAGTASVIFDSGSPQTLSFANLPAGAAEFNNVTFNGGAATVTFTMAGNPLAWSGTLAVAGGSATTTLATSGLSLNGGALAIGNGGSLAVGASSVIVTNVTMTGGASGAISATSGAWTLSGSWDTSGAGSTLSLGTSTVVFSGTTVSIGLGAGQSFYRVTISGSASLATALSASASLSVGSGAVLTMTGQSITFNDLDVTGTGAIANGTTAVAQVTITNSDPANLTTVSSFSLWNPDGESRWTHSSTVGTSTLTFTLAGNTPGARFIVTKDGVDFTTGFVDASGQVVFTMQGSDPVVDVIVAAPCGGVRYWVGGPGNWSDTAHWSATSGGAGGCNAPGGGSTVLFDANSGGGTVTLNQNAGMGSLDTTGWAGTLAVGTYNFTVGGDLTLAGGSLTIGSSAGSGVSIAGGLTLSGSAVLDGSAGASVVTVGGNTSIASSTAYVRMGSGAWTFSGTWSNASTSANWTAGTGTVVFNSATSVTTAFGALPGNEFYNVVFSSTSGGAVTFTMGADPLRWGGTLTVQDAAGTTTLATADLGLVGGSLVVGNAGILLANASPVGVSDVTVTGGTSGTLVLTTGTWTVSGNWDTSGANSTFTPGTGTVILSGSARTLKILDPSNGFHDLTVSGSLTESGPVDVRGTLRITGALTTAGNALTGGASLVISGGGALFGMSASIAVSSVTMNDASANTLSMTSGSFSVSGAWDTSGAASSFTPGTSTVTLTSATGSLALGPGQIFASLVVSGGYALSTRLASTSLTISAGALAKGIQSMTVMGDLLLSGGSLTSISGDVTVGGSVDISSASSFIGFGSETWTIGGAWTNASTSASWSAGTGTVVFASSSSQAMTFAGTALPSSEFHAVVFNAGTSTVTFTLQGPALRAQTVTVQGGGGTTTVDTSGSDLPITADTLIVATGGVLSAHGSTLTVRAMDTSAGSFTAATSTVVVGSSGGIVRVPQAFYNLTVSAGLAATFAAGIAWSGTLTLSGAAVVLQGNLSAAASAIVSFSGATITATGSWDTSVATTFVSDGSTVTLSGVGQGVDLGAGQAFATLVIAGSSVLASNLATVSLTVRPGGTLTKTNHAITFNDLTVDGTIADGSVNVTGLAVTNNDAAARVTISVFTAWSAGREYAWTFASSLSTATITWTIHGNTPGFVYHVTKDSASFADGTVAISADIVLPMLGSDPSVWVGVSAPPILPWWQSPYFLGILPLPFLMVVTMFAQRRRWRPTKAFLVDERGQLLREFSLDPSCDVTYDQAREAGALGAVDKDVRVAKYNARAVRGDMLSLIVLAVGPADVEETEFARGLLQSIQDRLEDSARDRVAEARSAEESLKSAREASYEERADLQARARVFGDMVNAFTIARTKLDVDSQKLRKHDGNLREREESLAEVRASLEEQAARATAREAEMERAGTELKAKEQELEATENTLLEREKVIGPREEAVDRRAREVTDSESDLAGRESLLAAAKAQLTTDLDEYHKNTDRAAALQAELAEERKALDDLSAQLDEQTKTLMTKTASAEAREHDASAKSEELRSRLAELEPREQAVAAREADLGSLEDAQAKQGEILASRENQLRVQQDELKERETALATRAQDLAGERKTLDELTNEAVEERKALDAKADDLAQRETDVARKVEDLDHLKANLGPREASLFQKESDLSARERTLADERKELQTQQEVIAAKALEVTQQMEQIKERETALAQEKMIIQDAKAAFEDQQRELEASRAGFAKEVERRRDELGSQEKTLGDARLRLSNDAETFEAQRLEKSQWIASKEIELEAKEQSLLDREQEIRAQAEDNARRLSDLAAREEALEIEGDKLDKARAEAETRKAETGALARDLEARTARFRQEEADKGEELRTWQTTLESEQALLKEQRETFEKEMLEVRESWAGRMIRVEQREEEFREREAKVQADVEWVAKNESELSTREKAASETLKATTELQTKNERVRQELEQRAMEIESRERGLHEEAAEQSVTLEKRAEVLQAQDAGLQAQRAQWERELTSQVQKMKDREAEVQSRKDSLDAQVANLTSREEAFANRQAALRQDEDRLAREKADAQGLQKHLEAGQLELAQARERLDAESVRLAREADAIRQTLAAKDADLSSERDRLERESSALQDKLGTKAKEMASREKAVTAREAELRSEEQDLDARVREIESRERQAEAHLTELNARADALTRDEADLRSRHNAFDDSVRAFESQSTAQQKEWKDLQTTLKSQEAQLAASAETRQAEIRKRMEELEQRERSLNASQTQAQIERTRLEAQAKAQSAKQTELDAAAGRADKRFSELKAMEAENLRVRQETEVERAAWSNRRSEELKQLEATRDAAAEQTQQAEQLIEDSQRRAYVAAEAEKASKRQAEELASAHAVLEKRRADAEKAEKDLEVQMAQLREASQRLGSKELDLTSRAKDLDAAQARLAAAEKKAAETAESLKARKASLDQEAERVAGLAAAADQKEAEAESRRTSVEARLAEVTKREQILSTELQRADNLMEDLNRKEAQLQTRDSGLTGRDRELAKKEETLTQRDAELKDGLQSLERLRREQEVRATQLEHEYRAAADTRKEADGIRAEAQKLKAQADAMQAEVAKNMRFLQKKALDVLDREEKIRAREVKADEQGHLLESRAQILEQKDRVFDTEKSELTERLEKMRQETEKLKAKLAEAQAAGKSTIDMDEWKRDIENRVKIIQKKALDLLDREEKLRKKEEELRALAAQLGVTAKA